jgi:glycosyltransferase involved in cell wall biosynthesis
MSVLFDGNAPDIGALWVSARGDTGALAAVAGMSQGIPVIVDRLSDFTNLVAHQITGFIADDLDPASTVALLAQLLSDADAHNAMSEASIARAQRLHSWSAVVDRVLEAAQPDARRSTNRSPASAGVTA